MFHIFLILKVKGFCGAKEFGNLSPFHIKPKAHAEEEEMSEDKRRRFKLPGAGQSCPRQIKITEGKSSTSPKAASQSIPRVAMRVWWRSNSRRNCHLCIKCPQLISWLYLCGHGPWTVLSRSPQLIKRQKEWLMRETLKYRHGWLTSVGPK